MKVSNSSSADSSATTSTSAPATQKPDGKSASGGVTESQYLAKQAEDARAAIQHTLDDLKHSLAGNADVREWTRKYPWIATGTAIAAGVAAGYALTPRDKDEVKEMWEKLKDSLASAKSSAAAGAPNAAADAAPKQPSLLGTLLREAIKMAGPLLTSVVAASGQPADPNDGHQPPASS